MSVRHFLTLADLSPQELERLIQRAITLKRRHREGQADTSLKNKVLAMIFEKASTRTRVSFEAGMIQLGGGSIFLSSQDSQLGRGEPLADTAKVLSEMVDAIMVRTYAHADIETLAANSSVPVINALSDDYHPCQLLADVQTFVECRGSLQGKTVTWVGDGNNMCNSYINAARQFDFQLRISCPEGYEPNPEIVAAHQDRVTLIQDPKEAVSGVHLVATDVWASMGQEEEHAIRAKAFADYQVSPQLMNYAAKDALFMHCLPAHRGEEISEDMLDDHRSVVWQEAGNRLHAQKALLEFLITESQVRVA